MQLDESDSGMSEDLLSVIHGSEDQNSDCQNLVSQNSGTVNILVNPPSDLHLDTPHKRESSESEDDFTSD